MPLFSLSLSLSSSPLLLRPPRPTTSSLFNQGAQLYLAAFARYCWAGFKEFTCLKSGKLLSCICMGPCPDMIHYSAAVARASPAWQALASLIRCHFEEITFRSQSASILRIKRCVYVFIIINARRCNAFLA